MAAPSLRLLAEDAEDLQIISAALQDAVGRVGDIFYEPAQRRVTLVFNRSHRKRLNTRVTRRWAGS